MLDSLITKLMKIKIGDKVTIIKGKDSGKSGLVKKIFTDSNKVIVENINMVKKHLKPRGNQAGGIFDIEKPLAVANVALICPACGKKTRIGLDVKAGKKQRICKKCGVVIESPKNVTVPVKAKKESKTTKTKKETK